MASAGRSLTSTPTSASGEPMQRLLMGEVGSGKAQPLDSLVLAPSGFRPMGELRVGDPVVAPDGTVTSVIGVFPQGVRDVWKVSFSDGTTAECDPDHLWEVQTSTARWRGDGKKILSLREIEADLLRPSGYAKWHVELPQPVDLEGCGLRPLDPYLIGLLLGDGGLSTPDRVRFSSADDELVESVARLIPDECRLKQEPTRRYDWLIQLKAPAIDRTLLEQAHCDDPASIVAAYEAGASCEMIAGEVGLSYTAVRHRLIRGGVRMRGPHRVLNPVRIGLTSLGLMGKTSVEKAVPAAYKAAPIKVRHAVLQGLLDTDGTINAKQGSNVTFTSASRELAEDVAWLARSLGGKARCRSVAKAGGAYSFTSLALPNEFPPFRLRRKANLVKPRTKYAHPAKAMVAVECVGRKQVQCIAVAHPSQLYVTDGFTTTHKTVVAVYAMLRALEAGRQAALMAPTETLAEQHAATLDALLGRLEADPVRAADRGDAGGAAARDARPAGERRARAWSSAPTR